MTEGMASIDRQMLATFARKYIWWKSASEAVAMPERVLAQAEAGRLGARPWACWHYRLGLAGVGQVPKMPRRSFA